MELINIRNLGTVIPNSTVSSSQAQVVQIASAQSQCPSCELIEDTRQYSHKCVPLYKLALKGDWNAAKRMIDGDSRLLKGAITKGWGTLLHAVAGSKHVHFVKELIKLLDPYDLELKDYKENTAFCYAAASGNLQIASMMIKKNVDLPQIRGEEGRTPLYMAAFHGRSDMARYLYAPRTTDKFEEKDWNDLFFICIQNGLHDLALQMFQTRPMLALARNEDNETGLHVLARKPSHFSCQCGWSLQNFMNSSVAPPVLQLVGHLWRMLLIDCTEPGMSLPLQVTFDAIEVGNFHFVAELLRVYPALIHGVDAKNRSIIHIAILYRHSSIFTLINELASIKDIIAMTEDDEGNSILHCAAKSAPPDRLDLISGPALQMTHELLWFEEVKKMMLQSKIEKKNSNGKTPRELFTEEHQELLEKAKSWTESTAMNCML